MLCSCASNSRIVAKATATQTYATSTYEHRCVGTGNPPAECKPCQEAIHRGVWMLPVAQANRDQGYIPSKEKAELEALKKDLDQCP